MGSDSSIKTAASLRLILSPLSRQVLKKRIKVYLEGIFLGELRRTHSIDFKKKAVAMYLNEGKGYQTVAKELGIRHSTVQLWDKRFREEGEQGLEERRGRGSGPTKGRPKTKQQSQDAELHQLRVENLT